MLPNVRRHGGFSRLLLVGAFALLFLCSRPLASVGSGAEAQVLGDEDKHLPKDVTEPELLKEHVPEKEQIVNPKEPLPWHKRAYPTCSCGSLQPFLHKASGPLEIFSAYVSFLNKTAIRTTTILGNPTLWSSSSIYALLTVSSSQNAKGKLMQVTEVSTSCTRGNFRVECIFIFEESDTIDLNFWDTTIDPVQEDELQLTIAEALKYMAVMNTSLRIDLRFETMVEDPTNPADDVTEIVLGGIEPQLCDPFSGTPRYHLSFLSPSFLGEFHHREWITYHLMIGYQHFFIYEDGASDNTAVLLQPFIDAGLVTFILSWTDEAFRPKSRRSAALEDWLFRFGAMTQYVSIADGNSYFMPMLHGQPIMSMPAAIERLDEGLSHGEGRVWGQYHIESAQFGSLELKAIPALITQAYRFRHEQIIGQDGYLNARNSIARSSCIKEANVEPYYWTLHPNCSSIDSSSAQILVMNYYQKKDFVIHSKSVRDQSSSPNGEQVDAKSFFAVEDTRMFYYGPRLRELMNVTAEQLHVHLPHLYSPLY